VTRAGVENLVVSRGTDGSNPVPSRSANIAENMINLEDLDVTVTERDLDLARRY
jgi:hypothetical protein